MRVENEMKENPGEAQLAFASSLVVRVPERSEWLIPCSIPPAS
jgi:hypothetical protein